MTPRERLLADIRRLADGLPCVGLADGRLEIGVREARLAGLKLEPDGRPGLEGDAAMAEACSKASAVWRFCSSSPAPTCCQVAWDGRNGFRTHADQ